MPDRYTVTRLHKHAVVLHYDYGYTKVECSSETGKTIIRNITGDKWIPEQVDRLFGLGEYKKLSKHILSQSREKNTGNPHCIEVCIVANYLPKSARKDIKNELPDKDKTDLIGKYFK